MPKLLRVILLIISFNLNIINKTSGFELGKGTNKLDSIEQKLANLPNDSLRIKRLFDWIADLTRNDIETALYLGKKAQKIISDGMYINQQANMDYMMGNVYLNKADYRNALYHYLMGLRQYEKKKDIEGCSRILNNIGVVYSYMNNFIQAEKYFKQALALREKYGLLKDVGILYTSIGYIYSTKKDLKQAQKYYNLALKKGIANSDKYLIGVSYSNLGETALSYGDTMLAKKYFNLAIGNFTQIDDYFNLSVNYGYLGNIAIAKNQLGLAEKFLITSKMYAQKSGIRLTQMENYLKLEGFYKAKNDYKNAYLNRINYDKLKDSALSEQKIKQVNDLQNSYEIDKKNIEIELLNKEKELAEANANAKSFFNRVLIIACVFILVILIILWRNVVLKKRLNQSLTNENITLQKENIFAQYEVLKSKIDPHFLFNSLNTLSNIVSTDKEKAQDFIYRFSQLYRKILESGDHKLVTLNDELKLVNDYLFLQKVRFGEKLLVKNTLSNNLTLKIPGFALQMVVENAIKHNVISSQSPLQIEIYTKDDCLIVKNNLQLRHLDYASTQFGHTNIIERYKLLSSSSPTFSKMENCYIATLPLIT